MNLDQITKNVSRIIKQHFRDKEAKLNDETETDPITLSRGLVLDRLGPGMDKWGRDVELVLVKVLKKNEHHQKDDIVIWEIPADEELAKIRSRGTDTRNDLLRLWAGSPGTPTPRRD